MRGYGALARFFSCLVIAGGAVSLVGSVIEQSALGFDVGMLALALVTALFGSTSLEIPGTKGRISVSDTFVFTSLLLFGPYVAALTGALDAAISSCRVAKTPHKLLFNVASMTVSTLVSGFVFYGLLGLLVPGGVEMGRSSLVYPIQALVAPLLAMALTHYLLLSFLVCMAMALVKNVGVLGFWRQHLAWSHVTYLAGAVTALAAAWFYEQIGVASLILSAPVIGIIRFTHRNYTERIREAHRHMEEMSELHFSTIEALTMAIDAKDQITHGHVRRVQIYALELAKAAGVTDQETLDAIRSAALLHDIGKLGVPDYILNKPGRLLPQEYEAIKAHPTIGALILKSVPFPFPVVPIVHAHHERYDGKGYPSGLQGEAIPLGARIMAIADVYDALRSDRPYRPGLSRQRAMEIMRKDVGAFDPELLEVFLEIIPRVEQLVAEKGVDTVLVEALENTRKCLVEAQVSSSVAEPDPARGSVLDSEIYAMFDLPEEACGMFAFEDFLELLLIKLQRLAPLDSGAIMLLDPGGGRLRAVATYGRLGRELAGRELEMGAGLSGWSAVNRKEIENGNATLDLKALGLDGREEESISALVHPLVGEDRVLGTLNLYGAPRQRFDDEALRAVRLAVPHVARAVEAALRARQSRLEALTDELTGLPNQRAFLEQAPERLARAKRRGDRLSLLALRLEELSAVRERHGEETSDRVLVELGRLLRACVRDQDLTYRQAPDRFLILLPGCDREAAARIAERIQERLATFRLHLEDRQLLRVAATLCSAEFPHDGGELEELLQVVERRLGAASAARRRAAAQPELEGSAPAIS